jgi:hypothetical protein
MSTRQRQRGVTHRGDSPLQSGYEGLSSDLFIQSCGIEDVDLAISKLFQDQISPTVKGKGDELSRVRVRFSSGEKWSLSKLWKNDRDRADSLIFPFISVWRKPELIQSSADDIAGRGINQQTGQLIVSRRLVRHGDKLRQDLLNRLGLKNRKDPVTSSRSGELSSDPTISDGGLLLSDKTDNVLETISVPTPQFFTLNYEVTVMTQYQQQMNSVLEQIVSSYSQVGSRSWRLDTDKGYWFVATVDENISGENTLEDESGKEKLLTHVFSIKVPMYIMANDGSGKVPVTRTVSSNVVDFSLQSEDDDFSLDSVVDPNIGADDPTIPLNTSNKPRRRDLRETGASLIDNAELASKEDPAVVRLSRGVRPGRYQMITYTDRLTGNKIEKLVKLTISSAARGELSTSFDMTSIDANSGIEVKFVTVK